MSGITEQGKEILRRFKSMDPAFAEAVEEKKLPRQKSSFDRDLTELVNRDAKPGQLLAIFTNHEGKIKHRMNLRKVSALSTWEPQKLMNVYGIERQDLVTASAAIVARMPRDPAVERVLDLH